MKLYILVINRNPKEQYIIDETNVRVVEQQILNKEDLNFSKRNAKNVSKYSIMGIKNHYVTHWELIEGEEINDGGQERSGVQ